MAPSTDDVFGYHSRRCASQTVYSSSCVISQYCAVEDGCREPPQGVRVALQRRTAKWRGALLHSVCVAFTIQHKGASLLLSLQSLARGVYSKYLLHQCHQLGVPFNRRGKEGVVRWRTVSAWFQEFRIDASCDPV